MTSQHNPAHDPFTLLDTDVKISPVLTKSRLDEMIGHALSHEQINKPRFQKSTWLSGKGWWSGGLATAACLILLLSIFPQSPAPNKAQTNALAEQSISTSDDVDEIADMMFLDTIEGY